MEIGFSLKGDLQVLTIKGSLRLQNWKVVDKHLDSILEKGCRKLVVDMTGVSLICSSGVGALFQNIKKFRDHQGRLLLFAANPYMHGVLEAYGGGPFLAEHVVQDWQAVADRLSGAE
jgi:anti-anti-sigma factor